MERVNITLDDERAEKLSRLAQRMHVQPGTVARSLLAHALDEADPDPRNVVELLDGIDGAYERAATRFAKLRPAKPSRSTSCSAWRPSRWRPPLSRISTRSSLRTAFQPTPGRASRSLRGLERFPLMGPELTGRWTGFRFVLGPWRWLLLVCVYRESEDRVVVVTVQDGRSSMAATGARG